MMKEEAAGRKHPIHTPTHERFNTPIIIFLTLCTKDRKPLLANPEAHAILRGVWEATDAWFV
jgi:putative transposase